MAQHKPFSSYVDEAFRPDATKRYKLSIRFMPGGLSFFVSAKRDGKLLVFLDYKISEEIKGDDYAQLLDSILTEYSWLNAKFYSVVCLVESNTYTFVPDKLFKPDAAGSYLKLTHRIGENAETKSVFIEEFGVWNIFLFDKWQKNWLEKNFKEAAVWHTSGLVSKLALAFSKEKKKQSLLAANIRDGVMDIVLISKRSPLLINTFHVNTKEDFIYFLLVVMEKHNMNTLNIPLYLMGKIEKDSKWHKAALDYFHNVYIAPLNTALIPEKIKNTVPGHIYDNILFLSDCE